MNVQVGFGIAKVSMRTLEPGSGYLIPPDTIGFICDADGRNARVDFVGPAEFRAQVVEDVLAFPMKRRDVLARPCEGARNMGTAVAPGILACDPDGHFLVTVSVREGNAFLSLRTWSIEPAEVAKTWREWMLVCKNGQREEVLQRFGCL